MNALLRQSDFISVHVPLLPKRRMFDAEKFARMSNGVPDQHSAGSGKGSTGAGWRQTNAGAGLTV